MRASARILAIALFLAFGWSASARGTGDYLLLRYLSGSQGTPERVRLVEVSTGKVLREYNLPPTKGVWLAPPLRSMLYETEEGEVRSFSLRTGVDLRFGRVPAAGILRSFSPSGTKGLLDRQQTFAVVDLRSGKSFSLGERILTADWAAGKDVALFTKPQIGPLSSLDSVAAGPDWRPRKANGRELSALMGWWWRRLQRQRLELTTWVPSRTGRSAMVIEADERDGTSNSDEPVTEAGRNVYGPTYVIYNRRGGRLQVKIGTDWARFIPIAWSSSERYLYGHMADYGPLIRIDAFTGQKKKLWTLGRWWPVGLTAKP